MPRPLPVKFARLQNKVIKFTGGLNEELSSLELKPGELFEVINYEEIDGEYPGYRSVSGYERYDGVTRTIEYPLGSGEYSECIYPSDAIIEFDENGDVIVGGGEVILDEGILTERAVVTHEAAVVTHGGEVVYHEGIILGGEDQVGNTLLDEDGNTIITEVYYGDAEREFIRSQIEPVPGVGSLLATFVYGERIYAIREAATTLGGAIPSGFTALYHSGSSGWTEVTEWPTDVPVNDVYDNPIRFSKGALTFWPTTDPNTESVFLANGLYFAIALHRNPDGTHVVTLIDSEYLPDGTANPDRVDEHPMIPQYYDYRLYLAYPQGYLFYGNGGEITFDPVTDFAGNFNFASPITNLVPAPGNSLIVWLEKGIKVIKSLQGEAGSVGSMVVEEFSDRSSAIPQTASRFLGTMIFLDDRGVTLLDTHEAFGDFKAASTSKRIQKTLQLYKDTTLFGYVNRKKNQYILLFRGGRGMTLTFDVEKKVKGATLFDYGATFTCGDNEAPDGDSWMIFGDSAGYVQVLRDAAASFDGDAITTRLATSYSNYGSPVNEKNFLKILFEITGDSGTLLQCRPDYDYRAFGTPKAIVQYPILRGDHSVWGSIVWGNFRWSGAVVDTHHLYIRGYGVNMSMTIATSDKYRRPHTIHNMITTYTTRAVRF